MDSLDFGFLRARIGKDIMCKAKESGVATPLYPHLVFEGEVSCLFSDTNIGKSIFAVQIGCHIAKMGHRVAYYDFELNQRQFYKRYSDEECAYSFPDSFIRLDIDPESGDDRNGMVQCIEQSATALNADTLIIDNLSWLCLDSEDGASAASLMKQIKALQSRYGWTIIVVAHTPKRNESLPITINDLAGSRQLANFFDSIFAIGRCVSNSKVRYLKQLKVRSEEIFFSENNIVSFVIGKKNHMLRFISQGYHSEKEMLQPLSKQRENATI